MKKLLLPLLLAVMYLTLTSQSCDDTARVSNTSAKDEQEHTEVNQQALNRIQPPPTVNWSLERDNLIKRFKLQNDRSVVFYMYIFNEGIQAPIGYYQVNKVSSVNSQLTNPMQVVKTYDGTYHEQVLPSPDEAGAYSGTSKAVFGFTPEEIYIETSLNYIASTVPLNFPSPPNKLAIINVTTSKQLGDMMKRINGQK